MTSSSAAPTQHRSVGAPIRAVDSSLIPRAGPIAIVAPESSELEYYTKELTEKVPHIQIKAASKETSGVIWLDISGPPAAERLDKFLSEYPQVGWVQLPQAGINAFANVVKKHNKKVWTSAKGSFGQPVAEHALCLILALLRKLPQRVRATTWGPSAGLSLFGRRVTIIGAGGITLSLLSQIAPFAPEVTVLRRKAEPLDDEVVPEQLKGRVTVDSFTKLHDILPKTEILVIAAALTPETKGMIGEKELSLLPSHGILVNVARGEHVQTDALVDALRNGTLAGAGIDVTAPEPLPDGHALWNLSVDPAKVDRIDPDLRPDGPNGDTRANLIITPHTADTQAMCAPLLVDRFATNAKALLRGDGKFEGVVDTEHAY
ncbi:unnamed protein product [Parajaminaea phylloscopi]